MSKLTIPEAVRVVPVSESTLRRDIRQGKVSCTKDAKNRKVVDQAELERVYDIKPVNDSVEIPQMTAIDSKLFSVLEAQIADLKAQLETASEEKAALLTLLKSEQDRSKALMPPVDDKPKSRNWLLRLVGAR